MTNPYESSNANTSDDGAVRRRRRPRPGRKNRFVLSCLGDRIMRRLVQLSGVLAVGLSAVTAAWAQQSDEITALRNKIQVLEKKVAGLEAQVATLEPLRQEYEQREIVRKEIEELGGTPGPIESTNRPIAADTVLHVGEVLQVEQGGWWAGRVMSLLPDGKVKVHYPGWDSQSDEVVPRTRLQLDPDALAKAKKSIAQPLAQAAQSPPGPITPSEVRATETTVLKVGDAVQAESGNRWWAGEVLSLMPEGNVKIHYVGWDAQWDEVVIRSRLRLLAGKR